LHILSEAEKEPMRRSNGLLVVSGDNEILNANGAQALNPLGCATNRHLNISFHPYIQYYFKCSTLLKRRLHFIIEHEL
jgi:hypothetical protein